MQIDNKAIDYISLVNEYYKLRDTIAPLYNMIGSHAIEILLKIDKITPIKYSHCLSFQFINDDIVYFYGTVYDYSANDNIEVWYSFPNEIFYNEEKLNEYLLKLSTDNDIKLREELKIKDEFLKEQETKEKLEYDRLLLEFNKNGNLK